MTPSKKVEAVQAESSKPVVTLNFDGLCEPKNPGGVATYGVVIKKGDTRIYEGSGLADAEPFSDEASNNVAEYSGIIKGLEWLLENRLSSSQVLVRGDSKLVINQLNGTYKVKAPRIVELYKKARELISQFNNIRFEWVDRSLNSETDLLSRIAYSKYLRSIKRRT